MIIEHLGMYYYTIFNLDGSFDLVDDRGHRPLGLHSKGPWKTEEEAKAAVLAMTEEEAAE